MKKILILSYFFPPCNLTAAQRAYGWAKYLKNYGYYPIIITRNWDKKINDLKDISIPAGENIKYQKTAEYEVYYTPFCGSLRDKIYAKYGDNKCVIFRRFLSFVEIVAQNFFISFNSFKKAYDLSKGIIQKEKIDFVIVSGNPFIQFKFGYKLQKKFKIKWIADYRDDWTTDEINLPVTLFDRFIRSIDRYFEKKWVSSASTFTSVSPLYVNKIGRLLEKPGHVILNGFFEEEYAADRPLELFKEFTITYNGTLYPTQNIEPFSLALKKASEQLSVKGIKLKAYFPGAGLIPNQKQRLLECFKGFESILKVTSRISRTDVFEIQRRSHLLVIFPHKKLKGIPSSKLFEYLGFKKPIVLLPSDNDIMENIIKTSNSGWVFNDADEFARFIVHAALNYAEIIDEIKFNKISLFTRKKQTQKLAKLLNKL